MFFPRQVRERDLPMVMHTLSSEFTLLRVVNGETVAAHNLGVTNGFVKPKLGGCEHFVHVWCVFLWTSIQTAQNFHSFHSKSIFSFRFWRFFWTRLAALSTVSSFQRAAANTSTSVQSRNRVRLGCHQYFFEQALQNKIKCIQLVSLPLLYEQMCTDCGIAAAQGSDILTVSAEVSATENLPDAFRLVCSVCGGNATAQRLWIKSEPSVARF